MTTKKADIIALVAILVGATGYYIVQQTKTTPVMAQAKISKQAITETAAPASGPDLNVQAAPIGVAAGGLDNPEGMEWFYKRFGYSTWFEEGTFNVKSFNSQEYETLEKAALDGNESATVALKLSIFKYLAENPGDSNFSALKEKLYSKEYLLGLPRFDYIAEMLPKELLDDKEFAAEIIRKNPYTLKLFTERIRSDKEIIEMAFELNFRTLEMASDALRNDRDFIKERLAENPFALWYISDELKGNKELVFPILKEHPDLFETVSPRVQNDPEVLPLIRKLVMNSTGRYFAALPEKLLGDREVIKKVAAENCRILKSASENIRDDEEIVAIAMKNSRNCLKYASSRLQEKLKTSTEQVRAESENE